MTEQNPNDAAPTGGDPFGDPSYRDDASGAPNGGGAASAKGREWLAQLETMINDIASQAAPVARQVAAKAAELTAVAAVKAGPMAQRAAEATTDAGQKLAERAQNLAAELRGEDTGSHPENDAWAAGTGTGAADADAGAEATFEDATDSTTDTGAASSFDDATTDRPAGGGTI